MRREIDKIKKRNRKRPIYVEMDWYQRRKICDNAIASGKYKNLGEVASLWFGVSQSHLSRWITSPDKKYSVEPGPFNIELFRRLSRNLDK